MSHPDYSQRAEHHASLLVLVKGIGGVLKNFNKLYERIQRINNIKVTDSKDQQRDIFVRYVRDYPVENNDWGDFQTHRQVLGLITLSKFRNQIHLNEICSLHESLKVKYSNTPYDSQAFMFGTVGNIKKPEQELETYRESDKTSKKCRSFTEGTSTLSVQPDSLSSSESSSSSIQEESFTIPSNLKTHTMLYGENDPVLDLEQNVADLINSLFWVVESKRLERSREKLDKVTLLLAPFEKKDFVGLDMESRNYKKRCAGRVMKNLADLTLQAGLIADSLRLYKKAAETLKGVDDWLWLGAAKEGLCAASAILLYPNLRKSTPLQRNASLQENSHCKVNLLNELTPSSSESLETTSKSETDTIATDSLASSSEIDYSPKSHFVSDLPSIPKQLHSTINVPYLLTGEEIAEKYRDAIEHYSKCQNAGMIETEACFKAARVAVEQNNGLNASSFLQNVIFINLNLSEQDKIQRLVTMSEFYKEIGFLRKAAFYQRLAAKSQVSASNPNPDWQRCYYLLLHCFPGHKLSLDPAYVMQHQVGWPALQIELLQELVVAAHCMGHPALATRHMTFLLQTMWPHLTKQQHRDMAIQLQEGLSAQCEGDQVPLVLETGEVIPPVNLTHVPHCTWFTPRQLPPARSPHLVDIKDNSGPFIFTPIDFGGMERKAKADAGIMEYLWVKDDICEVQMKLTNPLPFELKVSNMCLLTAGVVFESIPETIILPPDSPTTVNLHGTPKEFGELQILGYSNHTLGMKSNCLLKNIPVPKKTPSSFTIQVIPSLPTITVDTTVTPLADARIENSGSTINITLYNGESTDCMMSVTNTSNVPIEYFDLAIQSSMDNTQQDKIFQWSNDDIQSQLPVAPNDTAIIRMKLYADADFLDLSDVGDDMFPNSWNSNFPSRVGTPVSDDQTSSLPTQSSNNVYGSVRSINSNATTWSSSPSVTPSSRGRQFETHIILRYSGGINNDTHCRTSTLNLNLELLPSVCITNWDVLPAEIPSQLYLVLDVMNLTNEEMEFHYSDNKHILIESKEFRPVPVPLPRCPYTSTGIKPAGDGLESHSTNTSNSTNSLELFQHITNNVDLRWHLVNSDVSGKACVRGLTLSQAMMDMVWMSPLNWEVSLNGRYIQPQEEYNCIAGQCLSLGVSVSNHLNQPLHNLCLSVQFYQDHNNGTLNYELDNCVAMAGNNKVLLPILPEAEKLYHECTVVFLAPGEFKVDIQCSTTEPVLDNVTLRDADHPSIIQPCSQQVSHVWRFIPPVAIIVTEIAIPTIYITFFQ